jgi:multimeric flavodoxin WrbA
MTLFSQGNEHETIILRRPFHLSGVSMKILVILGSPRKGNTWQAAERIRETMQEKAPVEWEYIMLRDLSLEQCRGCGSCFIKGEEFCPINDDVASVVEKMQDADGVIFATPVYALQVSGLMKVFIDRLSYILHRPRFFRQKALLLTTAGAVGTSDVLTYLDQIARVLGFDVAARVGILAEFVPESRKKENERELRAAAETFLAALRKGSRSSPGFSDVLLFHGQRATFDELGDLFPTDYAYWKDQGWLEPGRRYFVDVPVNPIYHAMGVLLEWYQRRQIRKDLRDAV